MEQTQQEKSRKILAIDIVGTHLKVKCNTGDEIRKVPSAPKMTAERAVAALQDLTHDWEYDVISMGFPGLVIHGKILHEPNHLGSGWVKCDFQTAFGKPIKLINDPAMQAIGSYEGGRLL